MHMMVKRGNCKTHLPGKIALLRPFASILLGRLNEGRPRQMERGSFAATCNWPQNHQFFRAKQFCNYLKRFLFCTCLFFLAFRPVSAEDNRVIVCENGLEMLAWDLDFLKNAEQSVEMLPCFFGGDIAQILLKAVEKRLSEVSTLQVHMLASAVFMEEEDWDLVHSLRLNYPDNFHFVLAVQVPLFSTEVTTIDNHVKMFVVDEHYFSAGGTNLEERHCSEGTFNPKKPTKNTKTAANLLSEAMRDQDIVGAGPLAKDLRHLFFDLFSIWENYEKNLILYTDPKKSLSYNHYFEVNATPFAPLFEHSNRIRELKPGKVEIFLGGPHQKNNKVTEKYLSLIREAKEEIILEHLYFLPIDPILEALMDAARRGVKITLVTNGISEKSPDGALCFVWGNRMSYVPLFYGDTFHFWDICSIKKMVPKNTQIFEYNVDQVYLHKKVMLVDRKIALVGSYNFSVKSAYGDYELVCVIDSPEVTGDVYKVFQRDLKFSRQISPQEACEWYFDPFLSCYGTMQKRFSGFM